MLRKEWFEQQKSEDCLMNDWIVQIANDRNSSRKCQRTEEKGNQAH